eukprot:CAMPEP_0183361340 /NCGR_PEP_ID=MMETSP0164_2-20130417/59563_1 /TAXON_ID=221442 /ORGANISM="Coccolithus pelagicus ssp braarudi, Strain PLY182g" /LENGTH=175 /DNA_ID=CAMNT_0025535909 /DNA_START=287 /DNA_END=813 /DNA_ORIENTATION=-
MWIHLASIRLHEAYASESDFILARPCSTPPTTALLLPASPPTQPPSSKVYVIVVLVPSLGFSSTVPLKVSNPPIALPENVSDSASFTFESLHGTRFTGPSFIMKSKEPPSTSPPCTLASSTTSGSHVSHFMSVKHADQILAGVARTSSVSHMHTHLGVKGVKGVKVRASRAWTSG